MTINLQENQPVGSGFEIPHEGRSPDFVLRSSALPGRPVVYRVAPIHSDCIVPDLHRIPFSSALRQTPSCYNLYFSDTCIIAQFVDLSIEIAAPFVIFGSKRLDIARIFTIFYVRAFVLCGKRQQ